MGRLARAVLGVPDGEIDFVRRGFRGAESASRERLEGEVCGTFLLGYAAALEEDRPEDLAARLDRIPPERRGFAYEAAGMALVLRDFYTPWRRPGRFAAFVAGPGAPHRYIVHIGAGWVLARTPQRVPGLLRRLDPLIGWLALDGYGFHEGFFHLDRAVGRRQVPRKVTGYARQVFDQGLGRSLWFIEGARPAPVAEAIAAFAPSRHSDLWNGVGLAASYAGGGDGLKALHEACGPHFAAVAQGAAFAAYARRTAANPAPHTEEACRTLCALNADEAADLVEEVAAELPSFTADASPPVYELWRRRTRERLAERGRRSTLSSLPRRRRPS